MKRRLRFVIETEGEGEPDRGLAMIVDLGDAPTEREMADVATLGKRLLQLTLKTVAALETRAGMPTSEWTDPELEAWARAVESYRPLYEVP